MRAPRTVFGLTLALLAAAPALAKDTPSSEQILKASKPSEWHRLSPERTAYLDLPAGRVVIELAPTWSPAHVANLKTLMAQHYFDGTSVYRVQDNFVSQWGDPDSDTPAKAKSMGTAKKTLPPEFVRHVDASLPFVKLKRDVYAPEAGFSGDFPIGRDPAKHTAWIAHCYGTVGVARDVARDSGNANTLYAVIGAARRIDRNLAVVGRVVQGMQYLSSLPRGPGSMGFYTDTAKRTPIKRMVLAANLPASQRTPLEVLKTDSATFQRLLNAKRHRHDAFYTVSSGTVGVCDMDIPVRAAPSKSHSHT
ncbi:peptidylprolyl isomerase [Oleiagrimonas sp. C23AA]|uniref:peptidylprolyl isomerase n=1 Tax=Oleiagrimonas sp. C23AA TaxID=2719047 RepID=UPI001422E9F4|nr:peptidylprolyl isomerase [Oleiagrimonas sp. C23AA]NII09301.1 peptidylprolyl isomerase [Oleiagrimonas sp. C23AA]